MERIKFTAIAGDELMAVELYSPHGNGNRVRFDIIIDKYFHGVIFYREGEWVGFPNSNSWIQQADIIILGEIVDAHLGVK